MRRAILITYLRLKRILNPPRQYPTDVEELLQAWHAASVRRHLIAIERAEEFGHKYPRIEQRIRTGFSYTLRRRLTKAELAEPMRIYWNQSRDDSRYEVSA